MITSSLICCKWIVRRWENEATGLFFSRTADTHMHNCVVWLKHLMSLSLQSPPTVSKLGDYVFPTRQNLKYDRYNLTKSHIAARRLSLVFWLSLVSHECLSVSAVASDIFYGNQTSREPLRLDHDQTLWKGWNTCALADSVSSFLLFSDSSVQ